MNRNFWLFILAICVVASAKAGDFTAMVGSTFYGHTDDGTWYTQNRTRNIELIKTAYAMRYDTDQTVGGWSIGVQYTNFGMARSDALAPGADAPYPGGYIPRTGRCIGECLPNHRWITESDAQGIALIGEKHFGNVSAEAGVHFSRIATKAIRYIGCTTKDPNCVPPTRLDEFNSEQIDLNIMVGVAYKHGPWSVRGQAWIMEGRGEIPTVYTGISYTLMAGYTF